MTFAIQSAERLSHEASAIACAKLKDACDFKVYHNPEDVPETSCPIGRVDWVQKVLGRKVTPDYYPEFLQAYLHRQVWREDKWPLHQKVFIKPADQHKRFTGFVTLGTYKGKKKGPYWCSTLVNFVTEWRYYVAAGKVVVAKYGSGVEAPPPALDVAWPTDYHGAVDFGLLDTGEVALVEANSPFSCGWYGTLSEGQVYANWLHQSWQHLQNCLQVPGSTLS